MDDGEGCLGVGMSDGLMELLLMFLLCGLPPMPGLVGTAVLAAMQGEVAA